ncbi:sensor histidine kinase [Jeotgalibacillus marinus]|uniref:histidine kinase n=1 Tax=Jeotgalibacillus marinus TaxID=86667 RepID=A0ABV3Q6V2_9BACL
MIVLLVLLLGLSISSNIYMYRNRVPYKELEYAQMKLQQIIKNETNEKLLLNTDDPRMKSLLIEINHLLEHNQKTVANHLKLEQSMRKMLSNISHDLKTPLTVVRGYTEIMMNDENVSREKMKTLLQTVNLKTVEVLELINRFFELVKLESGDKTVEMSKVNTSEICRKKILDYYEILTSKDFEVSVMIPDEEIYAWGNELEIERILNNLLSNAIQYGSDGKMIGLELISDENHVFINVFDRGKGINELHKDHVFERMYTLEDSRNKLHQGSGLGLTITKRLVEKLGGKIFLESIPFKKTTFTIELKRFKF